MASKAIRRRTISAEAVKTSETRMEATVSGSTTEPLLQDPTRVHDDKPKTQEPASWSGFWDKTRRKCLRWAHLLSIFIAQSARNIVNVITDLGSLLGRLFGYGSGPQSSRVGQTVPINLSPVQEERLRSLRQRLGVPYDCSSVKHQDALKELWRLAYPNRELPSLKSDLWKEMGWQNCDPSTDFRAGGFMSLENLIYFARNYPDSFQRLLHKKDGNRAEWEYPFAVAGVNISYMLVQMLDLQTGNMSTKAAMHFVRLLEGDDSAFDNLFCVAFQMLDAEWLKRRATYMEFNEVIKSTRVQLEQELSIGDISRVQDMASFRTLER